MRNRSQIRSEHFSSLAKIFSRASFSIFAKGRLSESATSILQHSGYLKAVDQNIKFKDFFDGLFDFLFDNYRCEFIYKTALTNDVLNQCHYAESAFLSEFRVYNCLADLVALNGTSTVYEVKTALDSLDRLQRQLDAYRLVFDKINVLTFESQATKLKKTLPAHVGILYLADNGELVECKKAISNKENVDSGAIFDCLRVSEYTKILSNRLGEVTPVANGLRHQIYRNYFQEIPPSEIHDEMVNVLKNRVLKYPVPDTISSVPKSLKLRFIECKFSAHEATKLLLNLNNFFSIDPV